jgi:ubiquinone/menaquinone biosynthesis C-methylase UbiE
MTPRTRSNESFLPALRFDALTRFYDPLVAATTRERAFKERLVGLAAPRDGEQALDVGCGTGTLAVELARQRPGLAVAGVDADDAMLDRARGKADRAGVQLDLRTAFAQELPFADASFDLVVSSLFFHHLRREDKLATAAEILRVLRPGGRLAIADWGAPRDLMMRVAAQSIRLLDGAEPTADNLAGCLPALLGQAGFADVREDDALRTVFGTMVLLTAQRT